MTADYITPVRFRENELSVATMKSMVVASGTGDLRPDWLPAEQVAWENSEHQNQTPCLQCINWRALRVV